MPGKAEDSLINSSGGHNLRIYTKANLGRWIPTHRTGASCEPCRVTVLPCLVFPIIHQGSSIWNDHGISQEPKLFLTGKRLGIPCALGSRKLQLSLGKEWAFRGKEGRRLRNTGWKTKPRTQDRSSYPKEHFHFSSTRAPGKKEGLVLRQAPK